MHFKSSDFCQKTKYHPSNDILRITQLLPFYRYESDISSFLEDDTVLSDMEVFDLKIRASIVSNACDTCFEFRHCIQLNK